MALVLLYVVVLVLVAVVLFGVVSLLFGRGEPFPPLPRGTTPTVLPASGVTGADVDAVKFTQTLRGYKTSEVDWVLDRLGQELDSLRGQLSSVHAAKQSRRSSPRRRCRRRRCRRAGADDDRAGRRRAGPLRLGGESAGPGLRALPRLSRPGMGPSRCTGGCRCSSG